MVFWYVGMIDMITIYNVISSKFTFKHSKFKHVHLGRLSPEMNQVTARNQLGGSSFRYTPLIQSQTWKPEWMTRTAALAMPSVALASH